VAAPILALAASVSWGIGDFLGGLKSRSLPALTVLAVSQPVGLALLAIAVLARRQGPPGAEVLLAAPAALAGTLGLFAFYRGMARGAISIVAPIAGAAAVVPVIVGLATGDRPGLPAELGFAAALLGVVLASLEPRRARRRVAAGVVWAVAAAVGFGSYYVPMHAASQDDFVWAAFLFRATSTTLVWSAVLALRPRLADARAHVASCAAVGAFDTGGNVLFAAASSRGLVSSVSVLASLYPVVTVLLARAVLKERVSRSQELGVVLTLAGVVLVSTG
jgi:drug/metabolite transporter (DMT)-like permease